MAKLKFKYNNSTYSVTDDSVRDAEITSLSNSITSVSNSLIDYKTHMVGLEGANIEMRTDKWYQIFEITCDTVNYGFYSALLSVPISYNALALISVVAGSGAGIGMARDRISCYKMVIPEASGSILIGAKILSATKMIFLQKSATANFGNSRVVKLGETSETYLMQGHTRFDHTDYQDSDLDAIYNLN